MNNNNFLTAAEIDFGLRQLMKEDEHLDCVTVAVAKKVAREMSRGEQISMRDFEARALAATEGFTDPISDSAFHFHGHDPILWQEQFP